MIMREFLKMANKISNNLGIPKGVSTPQTTPYSASSIIRTSALQLSGLAPVQRSSCARA